MPVVHLVRHGEVHNPDRVLYGRLPGFGLSDRGIEQAKITAEWFVNRDIGYLVSSPLQRALQTAEPLAAVTGLDVRIDERLVEAENLFEGRQLRRGRDVFTQPANWKLLIDPLRPSWGEPYAQIAARVFAAVLTARDHAAGQDAVCVSHQLPIVAVRRLVEGRRLAHDPRRRQCALGSVTSLTLVNDTVVRVSYAEPAGATPPGAVAGA